MIYKGKQVATLYNRLQNTIYLFVLYQKNYLQIDIKWYFSNNFVVFLLVS